MCNDESANCLAIATQYEGAVTFLPGIYQTTSSTTFGAESQIILDGDGQENPLFLFNLDASVTLGARNVMKLVNVPQESGATVIWNMKDTLTLGAATNFIGTVFAGGSVSGGAGSVISCGNLYVQKDITIASVTSGDCMPGIVSVPEPETLVIFLLGLIGTIGKIKRQSIGKTKRYFS